MQDLSRRMLRWLRSGVCGGWNRLRDGSYEKSRDVTVDVCGAPSGQIQTVTYMNGGEESSQLAAMRAARQLVLDPSDGGHCEILQLRLSWHPPNESPIKARQPLMYAPGVFMKMCLSCPMPSPHNFAPMNPLFKVCVDEQGRVPVD